MDDIRRLRALEVQVAKSPDDTDAWCELARLARKLDFNLQGDNEFYLTQLERVTEERPDPVLWQMRFVLYQRFAEPHLPKPETASRPGAPRLGDFFGLEQFLANLDFNRPQPALPELPESTLDRLTSTSIEYISNEINPIIETNPIRGLGRFYDDISKPTDSEYIIPIKYFNPEIIKNANLYYNPKMNFADQLPEPIRSQNPTEFNIPEARRGQLSDYSRTAGLDSEREPRYPIFDFLADRDDSE